ncbi:MAG: hypothetical protein ACLU37_03655 [Collinsella sp.]
MADYSGHEDMWAAATRFWMRLTSPLLLQSPLPSLPSACCSRLCRPSQRCVPRGYRPYLAREHRAGRGYAAGIMENRRHERVNQILEEEIERLQSSTAKRTGRAYLSVIEGGTASFRRSARRHNFCMVKINRKWAVVTCLMALLIWGNSLVPGSGSGSLEPNGHGSYPRFPARRGTSI